jgi:hypothetical protein
MKKLILLCFILISSCALGQKYFFSRIDIFENLNDTTFRTNNTKGEINFYKTETLKCVDVVSYEVKMWSQLAIEAIHKEALFKDSLIKIYKGYDRRGGMKVLLTFLIWNNTLISLGVNDGKTLLIFQFDEKKVIEGSL